MLDELKHIAKFAGKLLKIRFFEIQINRIKLEIEEKAKADFVTAVDVEIEEYIREKLRQKFPEIHVIGEEGKNKEKTEAYFLVDPIDGTRNFMRSNPHFAVNITYVENDEPVVGVTYDPMKNEMFSAQKGIGAFLNGEKIKVSNTNELSKSIVAIGLPYRGREFIDKQAEIYRSLFLEACATRHTGSAALDLAYVACGRYDGFFEIYLSPWDVASGILMVKEAGGIVEPVFKENPLEGWLIATNGVIHHKLRNIIHQIITD